MMSRVGDPETLYTKQNCIGMLWGAHRCSYPNADLVQVVAALGRSTKGKNSYLSSDLFLELTFKQGRQTNRPSCSYQSHRCRKCGG